MMSAICTHRRRYAFWNGTREASTRLVLTFRNRLNIAAQMHKRTSYRAILIHCLRNVPVTKKKFTYIPQFAKLEIT